MTLDEALAHVGEAVTYRRCESRRRVAGEFAENGVITSVGTRVVYVRYAGDWHSRATDPADLTLIAGH